MFSSSQRTIAAIVSSAALAATIGLTAAPAGARVIASNDAFCAIFSEQFPAIDFQGLGAAEAKVGADLFHRAAKAGVPAKLKKDIKKLAKIYDRIAKGEPAIEVLDSDTQAAVLPSLKRFSKYFAANCITTPSP